MPQSLYTSHMADTFVIGRDEKPKCHTCHSFFDPYDMDSSNGEYIESCESRTEFPKYLPKFAQNNPYAFCSADCEQEAIDNNAVETMELEHCLDNCDTPSLNMDYLGSYTL